ncbi:MAG TPA: hypothetical protein VK425_06895, partial [Acidimicrobiales bacterium]|nr:hypothetical protein [Acidimicrobiales bacterium]
MLLQSARAHGPSRARAPLLSWPARSRAGAPGLTSDRSRVDAPLEPCNASHGSSGYGLGLRSRGAADRETAWVKWFHEQLGQTS